MLATLSNPTDVIGDYYPREKVDRSNDDDPEAHGKLDYIFTWNNGKQPYPHSYPLPLWLALTMITFENRIVFDSVKFVEFHKRHPDVLAHPFSDHPAIEASFHLLPKPVVRL